MKSRLLSIVLLLQVAWVLATVVTREFHLRYAPTVLLETQPVDPRDLLRGDYIILNHKFSRIPLNLFQPPLTTPPPPGSKVYVTLAPRGEFHEAVAASITCPAAKRGTAILRGLAESTWQPPGNPVHLTVVYGIERFFVAEGTGEPHRKITVRGGISGSGQASILEVCLDGRPYREAMSQPL